MFGGYGIYINDKIIALIAKQELYLKINHKATEFFKKFDPEFFSYKKDNKIIKISYWKAPAKFLENQELLQQYLNISLQEYTND
jgi:DNA transformation protein and related proteins